MYENAHKTGMNENASSSQYGTFQKLSDLEGIQKLYVSLAID